VNFSSVVLNDVSFVEQNKTNSPTSRHNTERFVRGIEYERAPHLYLTRADRRRTAKTIDGFMNRDSIVCTTLDISTHRQLQSLSEPTPDCHHIE
jgi:hypothetical protein